MLHNNKNNIHVPIYITYIPSTYYPRTIFTNYEILILTIIFVSP